jgi:RNA polymerase sigma-70 factor (ECF subfamily)
VDAPSATFLDAVRRDDDAARIALVRAWGPVVLRWCARLGGPGIDPEDTAHDVILHVLSNVGQLRAPEAFPTWLFQITRREVQRHRRRAWFRHWLPGAPADAVDPGVDPARADLVRKVQAALDALPAELREVLVLCDLEERPDPEAALLLAIPVGTVKSRLRRARAAFEAEARRRRIPEER